MENKQKIKSAVEAILFAAGSEISLESIASTISMDKETTKNILDELKKEKKEEAFGIEIIEANGKYKMCSKKEFKDEVFKIIEDKEEPKLTKTALEVLSIIAYNQNISKAEINNIRGVSSDYTVSKLLEYGLIEETGKKDIIGRPMGFGTTDKFLFTFGIENLEQMPELPNINEEDVF